MWGKYFIIKGLANSLGSGDRYRRTDDDSMLGCLTVAIVGAVVLAAIVYVFIYFVLPLVIVAGIGFALYLIIRKAVRLVIKAIKH